MFNKEEINLIEQGLCAMQDEVFYNAHQLDWDTEQEAIQECNRQQDVIEKLFDKLNKMKEENNE